jgi:hypothetical protein
MSLTHALTFTFTYAHTLTLSLSLSLSLMHTYLSMLKWATPTCNEKETIEKREENYQPQNYRAKSRQASKHSLSHTRSYSFILVHTRTHTHTHTFILVHTYTHLMVPASTFR